MDLQLSEKTAVVLAASKGLGKAIAKGLAAEGTNVVLCSRNEAALEQAVKEIKSETGNQEVRYVLCDVKKPEQIKQVIKHTVETYGGVDILINNAGGPPAGDFMSMRDEDWYHAFELNLLSFIRAIREVVPYMKKQGGGRIVNLSSSSIKQSIDHLVLSNTMRPGINGLTKSLARELGEANILINTIGPGTIETDRILELNKDRAKRANITPDAFQEQAEQEIAMKRYGQPEEFANTVVFFASWANTYITGQSLLVDGGQIKAL
ncbi:SDR family oxidoreductase [Ornithinibacillus gellani]|uniref:SDR family oxidoreductase n=1 Tax=Ornithinibacillus gellani TaxID=2293253 RepID=UPI000F464AEE|nr:SDR family oxidoreductase [Ornithinibacillus gellani]TQS74878.1 SDR family oxidoreductase [Ornithinibacillus gellani]